MTVEFPPFCPNGTLLLGFVSNYFPYVWMYEGRVRGVLVEFWNSMAQRLGCATLDFRLYDKTRNDSRAIQNVDVERGEVFTPAATNWLGPTDPLRMRHTTPVLWTSMLFVESSQSAVDETTFLSFYTVFSVHVLTLIVASLLIARVLSVLRARLRMETRSPQSFVDLARRMFYQYSFIFLVLTYQGYFSGNTLIASDIPLTSFSAMVASVTAGSRKVLLNSAFSYDEEMHIVLGSYSNAELCSDMLECFSMVCDDTSRVGLFYDPDIYNFYASPLSDRCSLAEIDLPRGQPTGVGWLTQSVQEGDAYYFTMSKSHPRWALEKINFALLTVYTDANMHSILIRRSTPFRFLLSAARTLEAEQARKQLQPFAPLSLLQITIPLEILAIGIAISTVVLVLELFARRLSRGRSFR